MLEYTVFNNWMYGTTYSSLDPNLVNIGVFNPAGIESLLKKQVSIAIILTTLACFVNKIQLNINIEN